MLGLVFVLFSKTILYLDNNANTFTVTEGIEYGYYSVDTEFDRHSIAVGLIYRPEYQDQMDTITASISFTDYLDTLVDIKMYTQDKKDGVITRSDALKLDPCSTVDYSRFYSPRASSAAFMAFLNKYKPM